MITLDLEGISLKLKAENGQTLIFDPIRKKWLVLTPEEHVRQYMIAYLTEKLQYPAALIAVEKRVTVGKLNKRFDIVVYSREHKPWMLVECKAPEVPITDQTLRQLLSYQQTIQCAYWVLTNGHQTFCADACDVNSIKWLESLPGYL